MQKTPSRHFAALKKKWLKRHRAIQRKITSTHKESMKWISSKSKHIAVGSMTGLLILAHPANASMLTQHILPPPPEEHATHTSDDLITQLASQLPDTVQELSTEQEITIAHTLSTYFNMPVMASLYGKRLNRSYGIIGAEQHLMRYPGDTMETHFQSSEDTKFFSSGMAPGRGAWGYFTDSRDSMTQQDVDRERYYIAVQTFLAPGWSENPNELYAFFKYRKMLVVNPENGKGIVVVIGDAGPSPSTGKHLGGSPEVMSHLERQDGGARGPVLYFFIDDPEDQIPLGPIKI
ncbi:hypothetical protein KBD81_05145 [Candidatus Woesebacteria bacterium]|nr:hypothetical protein [Candidatus Woesebacteria bacterium]